MKSSHYQPMAATAMGIDTRGRAYANTLLLGSLAAHGRSHFLRVWQNLRGMDFEFVT